VAHQLWREPQLFLHHCESNVPPGGHVKPVTGTVPPMTGPAPRRGLSSAIRCCASEFADQSRTP
jgi:hypothetical protein